MTITGDKSNSGADKKYISVGTYGGFYVPVLKTGVGVWNSIRRLYDIDSTGNGNYSGSISTTGNYAVNNIYDMVGFRVILYK